MMASFLRECFEVNLLFKMNFHELNPYLCQDFVLKSLPFWFTEINKTVNIFFAKIICWINQFLFFWRRIITHIRIKHKSVLKMRNFLLDPQIFNFNSGVKRYQGILRPMFHFLHFILVFLKIKMIAKHGLGEGVS